MLVFAVAIIIAGIALTSSACDGQPGDEGIVASLQSVEFHPYYKFDPTRNVYELIDVGGQAVGFPEIIPAKDGRRVFRGVDFEQVDGEAGVGDPNLGIGYTCARIVCFDGEYMRLCTTHYPATGYIEGLLSVHRRDFIGGHYTDDGSPIVWPE